MGILNIFKKKPTPNYSFQEVDREISLDRRKQNAEIRKLEMESRKLEHQYKIEERKAELEELKNDLYGDETEEGLPSEDNLIMDLLTKVLTGNPAVQPTEQTMTQEKINFTEMELRTFIQSLGRQKINIAKKMEDGTLKKMILAQIPNVSTESLDLAVKILRE